MGDIHIPTLVSHELVIHSLAGNNTKVFVKIL